METECHFNWKL